MERGAAAGTLPAKRVLRACPAVLCLQLRSRARAASAAFYVVFHFCLPNFRPVTPPALVLGPSTETPHEGRRLCVSQRRFW